MHRGGHNLEQLWTEFEEVLCRAYGAPQDRDKRDLREGRRIVLQLSRLDPTNEDFRYAVRRSGGPSLPDVDRLDVREFHAAMLAVANFLEAVDSQPDHYLTLQRDMDEEFRRNQDY